MQYLYPDQFKCLKSMGCCKSRKVDMLQLNKDRTVVHQRKMDMLDQFLKDNQVQIRGTTSNAIEEAEQEQESNSFNPLKTFGIGFLVYNRVMAFLVYIFLGLMFFAFLMGICYG